MTSGTWDELTYAAPCTVHTPPNLQLELHVVLESRNGDTFQHVGSDSMSVLVAPSDGSANPSPIAEVSRGSAMLRLSVNRPYGQYGYTVSVPETSSFDGASVEVLVRPCLHGEERLVDNTCLPCTTSFFSVSPEQPCEPCPAGAYCPGGTIVVPIDGYWQSSPLSDRIHRCMNRDACTTGTKRRALLVATQNLAVLEQQNLAWQGQQSSCLARASLGLTPREVEYERQLCKTWEALNTALAIGMVAATPVRSKAGDVVSTVSPLPQGFIPDSFADREECRVGQANANICAMVDAAGTLPEVAVLAAFGCPGGGDCEVR